MSPPLITISEARARVLRAVRRLAAEDVRIDAALDRVLAEDLKAAADVPPLPCSAMDGFALIAGPAGRTLDVVGESRAGAPARNRVREGEAMRISTGGAVPTGADAVIRQEDVSASEGRIETHADVAEGANVRDAGEDLRAGAVALRAGVRLAAAELGAAVGAGVGTVSVIRRPRLSVLCTGDELRAPGESLGPGEIHNSNAPMLIAAAAHSGAETSPVRRLRDDRAATEDALTLALEESDVVILTGGVSVGPHDHVKPALARLGVVEEFWGVSVQPGKPTWFGTREGKLVFGLPGNPVSAVVTFSLFARPALEAMLGELRDPPLDSEALLGIAVPRNSDRELALRVRLERRDGNTTAFPNGPQGSHIVSSLVGAHALALIPPGEGELAAGTPVVLEPLAH